MGQLLQDILQKAGKCRPSCAKTALDWPTANPSSSEELVKMLIEDGIILTRVEGTRCVAH